MPHPIVEQVDVDKLTGLYREHAALPADEDHSNGYARGYLLGRIDEYVAQNAVSDDDVAEARRRAEATP